MKKIMFALALVVLSVMTIQAAPVGIEVGCPTAFGPEFPADIQEASQAFEKTCKESQQKLAELIEQTNKTRSALSEELTRNSSYDALLLAAVSYDASKSEEVLAFTKVFVVADAVVDKFFDLADANWQDLNGKLSAYEKWQHQAFEFATVPHSDDQELLSRVDQELERRANDTHEKKRIPAIKSAPAIPKPA